jgi:hypothetical protein
MKVRNFMSWTPLEPRQSGGSRDDNRHRSREQRTWREDQEVAPGQRQGRGHTFRPAEKAQGRYQPHGDDGTDRPRPGGQQAIAGLEQTGDGGIRGAVQAQGVHYGRLRGHASPGGVGNSGSGRPGGQQEGCGGQKGDQPR